MSLLMKSEPVKLQDIYVPARLRATLDQTKVEAIAESIVDRGLQTPIQVRRDTARYVLVTGVHRLEAMRYLGETTIQALIVQARLH